MTNPKLVDMYERIREDFGPNFRPDLNGYTMQRELGGVLVSLEPPQDGLLPGAQTQVLLTAYLRDGEPEELKGRLDTLIEKRDALERIIYQGASSPTPLGKTSLRSGKLRDFEEGIEYVYDFPTPDELALAKVVMKAGSI